jgi:hypothetical protein
MKRYQPGQPKFAFSDRQHPVVKVDISHTQLERLRDPQAGGSDEPHQRQEGLGTQLTGKATCPGHQ